MVHQCYLCDPANPDRVIDGSTVAFPGRFVGPPERAHGGTAVAALTCPALQQAAQSGIENPVVSYVSGRLNLPVPLASPMTIEVESGDSFSVKFLEGDTPVVTGTVNVIDLQSSPGSVIQEIPAELASDVAEMSLMVDANLEGPTLFEQTTELYISEGSHYVSDCYGCSEKANALKLHMRALENGDLWTCWETDPETIDAPDRLATATIAAALDCSNLWVLMAREPKISVPIRLNDRKSWITGTHSVHFLRVPHADQDYRIVTRFLRQEGRKGFTLAALFDLKGEVYAVAEAVSLFIDLPPEII